MNHVTGNIKLIIGLLLYSVVSVTALVFMLNLLTSKMAYAGFEEDVASAMKWKYEANVATSNGRIVRWVGPTNVIPPSGEDLVRDIAEYKEFIKQKNDIRASSIEALKAKFGFTDQDIETLRDALSD